MQIRGLNDVFLKSYEGTFETSVQGLSEVQNELQTWSEDFVRRVLGLLFLQMCTLFRNVLLTCVIMQARKMKPGMVQSQNSLVVTYFEAFNCKPKFVT